MCLKEIVKWQFYYFCKTNVFLMGIWELAKERHISSQLLIIIFYFCRICKVSRPALSISVHRHFLLSERWVCSHRSAFYWKMHFPWMGPRRKDFPELWQHYRYEKPDSILSGKLNCFSQGNREKWVVWGNALSRLVVIWIPTLAFTKWAGIVL